MKRIQKFLILGCIIIALLILTGVLLVTTPQEDYCLTDEDCALSLCDCKCYIVGHTPEALEGKVCGINCLGEFGISGCRCLHNKCEIVTE